MFARKGNLLFSQSLHHWGNSKGPLDVVFCSDMVPFAPHLFHSSHLSELSIMGRDKRALR
jgi:hypothetical protein